MDPNTKFRLFFQSQLASRKNDVDMDINITEDAPTNAVGGGNVAGLGVGENGEPGRPKYKITTLLRRIAQGPHEDPFHQRKLN